MSKILITFTQKFRIQSIYSSYYNFLSQSLQKNHDVLMVNCYVDSMIFSMPDTMTYFSDDTMKQIINFNPDLIISFNHRLCDLIYKNTNCPVFIIEADCYNFWSNVNLIKKYQHRIWIGVGSKNRIKLFYDHTPFLQKDKIVTFKNATNLMADSLEQDIPISFLGTLVDIGKNYNSVSNFIYNNFYEPKLIKEIHKLLKKAELNFNSISKEEYQRFNINHVDLFYYISYFNRNYILDNLCDLGINIFGDFYNMDSSYYSRLVFNLDHNKCVTSEDNKNLYNRSKLSLNLHFAQNIKQPEYSSYSWRVCDIMATNACLVSTECAALDQDFGKWVKIPQFSNKHEAYDLCKKLLAEENWRKDIVAGSQLAIKEGGFSFHNRAKEIEEIFNLKPNENKEELKYMFLFNNNNEKFLFLNRTHIKNILLKIYYLNLGTILKKLKLENFIKKIVKKFIY